MFPHEQFTSLGVLVTPGAARFLEGLQGPDISRVIKLVEDERPLVLSEDLLARFLKSHDYRIINTLDVKKRFTINDFVRSVNEKYNFLQGLLAERIGNEKLVSINKCEDGKLSIIGNIWKISESDGGYLLDVEDPTGKLQASASKDIGSRLREEDVVVLTGELSNNVFRVENIVHPDIPIQEPKLTNADVSLGFITSMRTGRNSVDFLFALDEKIAEEFAAGTVFLLSDKKRVKNNIVPITNPSMVEINGIRVLFVLGQNPLDMIKKRFLRTKHAFFLLKDIPDIVVTDIPTVPNYKGITFIQTQNIINLKNREISFVM